MKDLQQRFGLARVILVGDRGMMTSGNLEHCVRAATAMSWG